MNPNVNQGKFGQINVVGFTMDQRNNSCEVTIQHSMKKHLLLLKEFQEL